MFDICKMLILIEVWEYVLKFLDVVIFLNVKVFFYVEWVCVLLFCYRLKFLMKNKLI